MLEIGIIGLGLIGGSIAKALKKHNSEQKIIAYDINQNDLLIAKRDEVIDVIASSIKDGFTNSDIIFICTPIDYIFPIMKSLQSNCKKNCIITDVGSTKKTLENKINTNLSDVCYIGGHPMAGLEKSGYDYSSEILLENAFYLLTKNELTDSKQLLLLKNTIKTMKAIPLVIDSQSHDLITANISHIPHILAAALVNMVKNNDELGFMHTLAAGGFKDITRIASSSPKIWEDICLSNSEQIVENIEKFKNEINLFEQAVLDNDNKKINELFSSSKKFRDSFESRDTGLIEKVYDISVSVEDKPGIIAEIATLLASHEINIRNIGIVNNREGYEGALRIEFYDHISKKRAIAILEKLDYAIHVGV